MTITKQETTPIGAGRLNNLNAEICFDCMYLTLICNTMSVRLYGSQRRFTC